MISDRGSSRNCDAFRRTTGRRAKQLATPAWRLWDARSNACRRECMHGCMYERIYAYLLFSDRQMHGCMINASLHGCMYERIYAYLLVSDRQMHGCMINASLHGSMYERIYMFFVFRDIGIQLRSNIRTNACISVCIYARMYLCRGRHQRSRSGVDIQPVAVLVTHSRPGGNSRCSKALSIHVDCNRGCIGTVHNHIEDDVIIGI
jgi:hypothetical protein